MSSPSPHIIVTEVPPGFLKRRIIRSHFSTFGSILRLSIQSYYCILTFETVQQASDAVANGAEWKGMRMKIDFTSSHDPFGTDDALINEELNWFAEDPDSPEPSKPKSNRSKSKTLDSPLKNTNLIDLTEKDTSRPKKHKERYSATTKFLEELKSTDDKVKKPRILTRDADRHKDDSKDRNRIQFNERTFNKGKLKVTDEDSSESMVVDSEMAGDAKSIMNFFDINRKDKESSPMFDDFRSGQRFKDRDSSPEFSKSESKSRVRLYEDRKYAREASPVILAENKVVQRIYDDKKRERESPPVSDDVRSAVKLNEDVKFSLKSNEAQFYKKIAVTLQDRLDILEERDRQIRLKPEESGLESVLQGTCPDMCPEKERILRELRNMVAPYEALTDGRMDHGKAVKEYTRSSADQGKPLPHELRPEPVLTMTMSYLINCIISRIDEVDDENLHNWYDFCWGRLRAIRKDIIQQDLCDKNTVKILEQCARFHIACYDRLWGLSKSLFDDRLNTETLNNCLTSLMKFYKDLRREKITCPHEDEFNTYLILLNMNSGGFLISEYQKYSTSLMESPLIKHAVKMHLAYHNNMFSTYFKLTKNTSYLNACLAQRFFQHVRTEALNTIIKSHCTPNKWTTITADFIMKLLKLDSIEDCVTFCESTGLTYVEDERAFKVLRNDFYISDYIYKIENPSSLILNKRVPIAEAVTGNERTLPIYLKHRVHDSFNEDGTISESALDASDQEEKMLRDNVERDLLRNHLKATLVSKKEEKLSESVVSSTHEMEVEDEILEEIEEFQETVDETENVPGFTEEIIQTTKSHVSINNESIFADKTDSSEPSVNKIIENTPFEPNIQNNSNFSLFNFNLSKPIKRDNEDFTEETTQSLTVFEELPQPKVLKDEVTPATNLTSSHVIKNIEPSKPVEIPKSSFSVDTSKSKKLSSFISSPKFDSKFSESSLKIPSPKSLVPGKDKLMTKLPSVSRGGSNLSEENNSPKSKRTKPYTQRIMRSSHKDQTKWEKSFTRKSETDIKPLKSQKDSGKTDKLRRKLSENMKKISARKYLRIWKEKTSKMRSLKELESMVLHDLPTKEYLKLWGKPTFKRSLNLSRNLFARKKSNVMVQLILHTDILNKIDKNVIKIGQAVINTLGRTSVKMADVWGNIAQPNPVFWKLIFALPPPLEEGTTFCMKLRKWCKTAFYRDKNNELNSVEMHYSDSGVPIIIKVCIIEGLHVELNSCTNLSALVLIRARNWETTSETQDRLEKILSLSNHPLPVAILNVGSSIDTVQIKDSKKVTYLCQTLWDNSSTATEILCDMARHTLLFNVKVRPFCHLLDTSVEKLFDSIRQDSFFHNDLEQAITNPNNIFLFYNQLIDKIEQEIKICKINNYYGTAVEFRSELEKLKTPFVFPDNYTDSNFVQSLTLRCQKCKLRPLKLNFNSPIELETYLKNYCDDISCLNVLKTLLRYLNLPEVDSDIKLSDHLKNVHWLPFVEMIVKEVLMSHLLTFKVAYRENIVKDVLDSHFWLELVSQMKS